MPVRGMMRLRLPAMTMVSQVDAGTDEVLYTFGYGGDGTDGGDAIKGFRRGQDKLKFVVNSDRTDITTLTAFSRKPRRRRW